jgi:hypothetical protein
MSKTVNKFQFADGKVFTLISVNAIGKQEIQGQFRPVIDAQFSINDYDALEAEIKIAGNTDTIVLIEEAVDDAGSVTGTQQFTHTNFSIVQRLAKQSYMISATTDTTPEVDEMRTSVLLGQLTYLEVQQKAQQAQIDSLTQLIVAQ